MRILILLAGAVGVVVLAFLLVAVRVPKVPPPVLYPGGEAQAPGAVEPPPPALLQASATLVKEVNTTKVLGKEAAAGRVAAVLRGASAAATPESKVQDGFLNHLKLERKKDFEKAKAAGMGGAARPASAESAESAGAELQSAVKESMAVAGRLGKLQRNLAKLQGSARRAAGIDAGLRKLEAAHDAMERTAAGADPDSGALVDGQRELRAREEAEHTDLEALSELTSKLGKRQALLADEMEQEGRREAEHERTQTALFHVVRLCGGALVFSVGFVWMMASS